MNTCHTPFVPPGTRLVAGRGNAVQRASGERDGRMLYELPCIPPAEMLTRSVTCASARPARNNDENPIADVLNFACPRDRTMGGPASPRTFAPVARASDARFHRVVRSH